MSTFDPTFFSKFQEMQAEIAKLNEAYAEFRRANPRYFHLDSYEAEIGTRFVKWVSTGKVTELTSSTIAQIVWELAQEGKIKLIDPRLFGVQAAPPPIEPEPIKPNRRDYEDFMAYVNGAAVINHSKKNFLEAQYAKDLKKWETNHENWKGRVEVMREAHERQKPKTPAGQIPLELVDSPDENAVLARIVDADKIRFYKQQTQAIKASRQSDGFAGVRRG